MAHPSLRALAGAFACLCANAAAVDYTFTGNGQWSVASNWSPGGPPSLPGDTVTVTVPSINDIPGLTIQQLHIGNGAQLIGNRLGITTTIEVVNGTSHVPQLDFGGSQVEYRTVPSPGNGLVLDGPIFGNGQFRVHGPLNVGNITSSYSGEVFVECIQGTLCGSLAMQGGGFAGNVTSRSTIGFGTIAGLFTSTELLQPLGGSFVVRGLSLVGGSYAPALGGTSWGATVFAGNIFVALTTLAPTLQQGFTPAIGQVFKIIDNQSAGTTSGNFNNLPQGAVLAVGGARMRISYIGGTGNDVTLTVLAPQTITFPAPPDVAFSSPPPSLFLSSAGGNSGNPVTFTSMTPAICSVFNAIVNVLGAGTCTITANQLGAGLYDDAAPVTRSFTVNKGTQGITFFTPGSQMFGTPPFPVTAVSSIAGFTSGNPIIVASLTPQTCTAGGQNGTTITIVHAGTCTLQAMQAGNENWNDAPPAMTSVAITKAFNTILGGSYSNTRVGDVFLGTATSTATLSTAPLDYTSLSPTVCTVHAISPTATALTIVGAGTCVLTVSQADDGNYFAAGPTPMSFITSAAPIEAVPNSRPDFDNNGKSDLVWQRADLLSGLWLMDGATQVGGGLLFPANTGWSYLMSGDLNGDGYADILWKHTDGRIAVWLMNGFTQIGGAVLLPAGTGYVPVMLGDFNGDGKQDIVWQRNDGTIALWLMNGITQIGGGMLFAGGTGWTPQLIGDFDGDGKSDIVWKHTDGRVALWLMNGAVQSGGAVLLPAATGYSPRLLADFNGDGKADILWEHTDGRSALWIMNGTAQVGGGTLFPAGTGWQSTRVADVNGDGKSDIIWQKGDGTIAYWLMNGSVQVGGGVLAGANTGFMVRRAADFNGDGRMDLVVQNVDGSYAMWLMFPDIGHVVTTSAIMPANLGWVLMK